MWVDQSDGQNKERPMAPTYPSLGYNLDLIFRECVFPHSSRVLPLRKILEDHCGVVAPDNRCLKYAHCEN
jgi:hypothetical protein